MCEIRWSPDAIVFNSWQHYGCPNYWMLHFFKESSGATLHPTAIQISNYDQLLASAITWQNAKDRSTYLRIKVIDLVLSTHDQSAPANVESVKKNN
jgi:alpha-N-arabinofuranosidase